MMDTKEVEVMFDPDEEGESQEGLGKPITEMVP